MKQRLTIYFLILFIMMTLTATTTAQTTPALLFFISGQSNAGSQGKGSDLNEYQLEVGADVLLYSPQFTGSQQFVSVPHDSDKAKWDNRFGPELGIYEAIRAAYPGRTIAFARRSKGGTSIVEWCSDTTCNGLQWTKDKNLKNAAVSKLSTLCGCPVEVAGIIWLQNEADVTSALASHYEARLTTMIDAWRDETGNSSLPVLFYTVHTKLGTAPANTLQSGLNSVIASVPYTAMVDSTDLPTWPGEPHFDSEGMYLLGQRFGEAWAEMVNN